MDISEYLHLMVEKGASDLFFSPGAPVNIKIEGLTEPIGEIKLTPAEVKETVYALLSDPQRKSFEQTMELNMALSFAGLGRFRVNVFRQRGEVAAVIRYIKGVIPSLEALNLPPILKNIVMEVRGLVLIVGATGSGKSTTLASMIDYRNQNQACHVLTIEDPIEYLHTHKKALVNQREVGLDTVDYATALKNAMREAPDVILIGEIRDQATMQHAITYAETGHLCLSTLHSNNANQAMERVINFFSEQARRQLLLDLSLNLRGIISMRLIPGEKNKRVPAVEVLLNSPYIADLIEKGDIDQIKETMGKSREQGMQTFDQALFDLYKSGEISQDNALRYADSRNNLRLQIRLSEEGRLPQNEDWTLTSNNERDRKD